MLENQAEVQAVYDTVVILLNSNTMALSHNKEGIADMANRY